MRRVTFGVANSLDNYIARANQAVDWLLWGDEAAEVMGAFWRTIDTIVMGRKSYEVALAAGRGSSPGMKTYVFSRTLRRSPDPSVEIVATDPVAFVRGLKSRPGKDICVMGGGELAAPLLAARVIDEIDLTLHPVLLGSGVPLFHPLKAALELELLECRCFKNGCVLLRYALLP